MTDREMLELAAKAAGIQGQWVEIRKSGEAMFPIPAHLQQFILSGARESWDPLNDDGDALRLAVKLRIDVIHNEPRDNDAWVMAGGDLDCVEDVDGEDSRPAATRRAITRAAAEIGKSMEGNNA